MKRKPLMAEELVIGTEYYTQSQECFFLCLDQEYYDSFYKLIYRGRSLSSNYYFSNVDGSIAREYDDSDLDIHIFRNEHDLIVGLYKLVNRLNQGGRNYHFDNYIKNKIKESQEGNPELWI